MSKELTDIHNIVIAYKHFLDKLIIHGKSVTLMYNDPVNKLYSIFLKRQLSLGKSIYVLTKKKRYYDACILTASLAENFILVKYLIEYEKVQDYVDYHCIETFPVAKQYPVMREEALKAIAEHNLKRFLKQSKTNKNVDLLDYSRYHAPWKNVQAMVDQLVSNGDKDITSLKFNYDLLCFYKHSGSYTLLSRTFDVHPENDAMIALGTTCMVLLHQLAAIAQNPNTLFYRNQVKLKEEFDKLTENVKKVKTKRERQYFS